MSNRLPANWYLHHGPAPQQHTEATTIIPAILSGDFGTVYSGVLLFLLVPFLYFLLTYIDFKHQFSPCSLHLPFPFGQGTTAFSSTKNHFFACMIPLFSLCKIKVFGRQVLVWPSINADLTIQYDIHNWSYFQSPPNFPLSSTWLVSTSRAFVQLPPNFRAFFMFLFKSV